MAEHNYITRTDSAGSVNIAEEVIATIAAEAVRAVDGVGGFSTSLGGEIAEFLGKKGAPRGVKVTCTEQEISVDVFFLVQYGSRIIDVAKAAQEAVVSNIEAITGIAVRQVNVTVCGVTFEKNK